MFLILKSSIGLMSMSPFGNDACCVEIVQMESDMSDEGTQSNCCGDSCEGACCAPVFTVETKNIVPGPAAVLPNLIISSYENNYFYSILSGIWHPPQLV